MAQHLRRVIAVLGRVAERAARRIELADHVDPALLGRGQPGEREVAVLLRLGLGVGAPLIQPRHYSSSLRSLASTL